MLYCVFFLVIISAVFSCVTPGMKAGAVKNSIPVAGKELLEEVHVIAIPAFYEDRQNWKEVSYEVLFASKRIKVLPPDLVDPIIKGQLPDFASLKSQERGSILARAGKGLPADALLNGMILPKDEAAELVIQLISLTDGRVLFWQAVDLSPKDGQIEHEAKKAALAAMLAPVLEHAGKRKKQAPVPVILQPKEEPKPVVIEPQPVVIPRADPPKSDRKTRKPKSVRPPDTISPM
ncbi:MAG: hypothetical protein C0402_08965 [Thermodesulfovibrio sp.]|nr:hypothetical protein [Thermodesulfovibrio sp.]